MIDGVDLYQFLPFCRNQSDFSELLRTHARNFLREHGPRLLQTLQPLRLIVLEINHHRSMPG